MNGSVQDALSANQSASLQERLCSFSKNHGKAAKANSHNKRILVMGWTYRGLGTN